MGVKGLKILGGIGLLGYGIYSVRGYLDKKLDAELKQKEMEAEIEKMEIHENTKKELSFNANHAIVNFMSPFRDAEKISIGDDENTLDNDEINQFLENNKSEKKDITKIIFKVIFMY